MAPPMESNSPVLDFKSTTLYAVRIVLYTADTAAVLAALDQRMADAAGFFEDEPVVIDASRLSAAMDWPVLLDALRKHRLPPIGVMAPESLLEGARAAGLAHVSLPPLSTRLASEASEVDIASAPEPVAEGESAVELVAEPPVTVIEPLPGGKSATTLIIERPLRSGQRVYARQADLVVLGVVSRGAEVIADGNIHVYGPLRGKAMAGARGDTDARIFTTQFDAELVAIAGVYRSMTDALPSNIENKPSTVRLTGEKLLVDSLNI